MNKNDLIKRTKSFAHQCIKVTETLPNSYLGNHIKGQLIRCATSVAANYRATCHAQSRAAFIAKISIVIEECDESEFWLDFAMEEKLLVKNDFITNIFNEANQLTSIFVKSRMTAKTNNNPTIHNSPISNRKSSIDNE